MKSFSMKYGLSTLTLVLIIFLTVGCRKKNGAGTGGENELQITAKHHSDILDSMTVYIKFNTQDAPESISDYDIQADVKDYNGEEIAIFSDLKDGEYYIYGKGWDPNYPAEIMEGGLPIKICKETSPIEYDLQVTEGGGH